MENSSDKVIYICNTENNFCDCESTMKLDILTYNPDDSTDQDLITPTKHLDDLRDECAPDKEHFVKLNVS